MRLLIVQYAGDYRAAFHRVWSGGNETYYAQKYSINAIAELKQYTDDLACLCCSTREAYDEILPNGVRAIGGGLNPSTDADKLIHLIENYRPTHLVLCSLIGSVLDWAVNQNIPILTTFAHSLSNISLKQKLNNVVMAKKLNHPTVEWVGSYGLNACHQLRSMGVNPNKIIPWDFLIDEHPGNFAPKALVTGKAPWQLCYVGSISPAKGVGDVLAAVARLTAKQVPVRLTLVGSDSSNFAAQTIAKLGIEDHVELLGTVSNSEIEPLMHEMDLVLVPSRHNYTEGFPLVIHHALRACTPIVASNHPMFRHYLQHRVNAMIFPAGKPAAMAKCIETVLTDARLYQQISSVSHQTWQQLRLPVKWADLLHHWLQQTPDDRQWLAAHTLASAYQIPKPSRPRCAGWSVNPFGA